MRADSHELWFAAILVALWAFESFHHPYTRAAIRYATTWRRYSIGLTVFTLAALGQFVLLLLLVNTVQTRVFRLLGLGVDPLWWAGVDALISALLLVVLSPMFPLARELRHVAWLLAGFPRLAQVVAGALRFGGDDGKARDALERSLADFETCREDVGSLLSERILATLIEIQACYESFLALAGAAGAPWWRRTRLAGFLHARAAGLNGLEVELSRLHRRTARAVHFIRDNDIAPDQTYPLADLSGDDAIRLLDAYRLAIAEALLSAVPRHQRRKFLDRFAYQLVRPVAELPVWPIPLAIGLDVAVFAVLTQLLPLPGPPLSFHRFAALAALHGLTQGLAVAWALYPKSVSTFARPGPVSLPWRSYLVFGLGSYLCGVGISALAYEPDAPIGRLLFILGGSVLFPGVTVSLSFLIDRRLQGEALGRGLWSLREGVVAALCVCTCDLLFRALAALASATAPPLLIMGALSLQAFVLGALLPGIAFNFLVRDRIRDPGRDPGDHAPLMHELAT